MFIYIKLTLNLYLALHNNHIQDLILLLKNSYTSTVYSKNRCVGSDADLLYALKWSVIPNWPILLSATLNRALCI
jgi:hypothetical protein